MNQYLLDLGGHVSVARVLRDEYASTCLVVVIIAFVDGELGSSGKNKANLPSTDDSRPSTLRPMLTTMGVSGSSIAVQVHL